ncbi:transposase [Alcaligenaceae bacterium]|nr:transposase [Alcaligenaceae bacterium]
MPSSNPSLNSSEVSRQRRYPIEVRQRAVELLMQGDSRSAVARELNVSTGILTYWLREHKKKLGIPLPIFSYAESQKQLAIKIAQERGLKEAAKSIGAAEGTVYTWLKEVGLTYKGSRGVRGKRTPVSHDKDFAWMRDDLPEFEVWRVLGAHWINEQTKNVRGKLLGLRRFFHDYLKDTVEKAGLPSTPAELLSRKILLPDFFDSCLRDYKAQVARVRNNYVHDFLNWVLLTELSIPDDHGRPVIGPMYHNPVQRRARGGGGQNAESVRSPLPYGYIDELRFMLAAGPAFSDWKWAQSAYGGEEGTAASGRATDWFEVEESVLDKSDPDCVWRSRRRESSNGSSVLEMWSPVRWVALLIKLCLPLRTMQVRFLDSGESDTWRYGGEAENAVWVPNPHKLKEGTMRKPAQRGVFRRKEQLGAPSAPNVVLYINTNKTADANLSGAEKGYELPWLTTGPIHGNPFYWLERLRNWQEKYNPVARRTRWSELGPKHLEVKSDVQLAGFADACFLFRMPELGKSEAHLPLGRQSVDYPWFCLLRAFESRLAERGEVHSDGSRIRLVKIGKTSATHFPLHSLRVSLITALALEGQVPFPILQKIAGHSRLVMTLYYTKLGTSHANTELENAAKRLDAVKSESIVKFLRDTEHTNLVKQAICNSTTSLTLTIEEHPGARNPAGWMPMHHGACLVGGNTSQIEENRSIGGCYNGGPNIGTMSTPRHAPVPGGARNCVRCRWFVTEPHYLWALQAHVNTLFYHSDEAMNAAVSAERQLGGLRAIRADAEVSGKQFDQQELLAQTERIYEAHMQRYSDLTEDVAATVRLMQRCVEQSKSQAEQPLGRDNRALIAVGGMLDVQIAVQEVSSELLQLAGVCDAAELYPDINPGKAVFRRGQLLDAALAREGLPPMFLLLSEEDQLTAGNAFLRRLSTAVNPANPRQGRHEVIALLDAGESLSKMLKLDVRNLLYGANNASALRGAFVGETEHE